MWISFTCNLFYPWGAPSLVPHVPLHLSLYRKTPLHFCPFPIVCSLQGSADQSEDVRKKNIQGPQSSKMTQMISFKSQAVLRGDTNNVLYLVREESECDRFGGFPKIKGLAANMSGPSLLPQAAPAPSLVLWSVTAASFKSLLGVQIYSTSQICCIRNSGAGAHSVCSQ